MNTDNHGLIDNWLRHIKDVSRFHEIELLSIDKSEGFDRLCKLNIIEQVKNVANMYSKQRTKQRKIRGVDY